LVLLLTRKDLEPLMDMGVCLNAVEDAFRQLALGNVSLPDRVSIPISKGHYLIMPAYVKGDNKTLVTKLVTDCPNNPQEKNLPTVQAIVLLFNSDDCSLLSIMDGRYFTAMRTGAASGVATKHLAREDSKTLGVIGTGFQARAQPWQC